MCKAPLLLLLLLVLRLQLSRAAANERIVQLQLCGSPCRPDTVA
jgi:hypothetical protein